MSPSKLGNKCIKSLFRLITLSDQDVLSEAYSLASDSSFNTHQMETVFILDCRSKYLVWNGMKHKKIGLSGKVL